MAIAESLPGSPPPAVPGGAPEDGRTVETLSLAGGLAGQALFFTYLAQAWSRDGDRERAVQSLEEAVDALTEVEMGPSLYSGFTGVAWAAEHLQDRLFDPDTEDPNEMIDDVLLDYLAQSPWTKEFDLIVGLVGIGVYALERLPRPAAKKCLESVVDRLAEATENKPEGTAWLTLPGFLLAGQRERFPRGYYNLGLAHGIPGVIAFLSLVCAAGQAVSKARPLLDGAVCWMLSQKLPGGDGSNFAYHTGPDIESVPARSAWCYGDPGIAAALLYAARCAGEPAWESEAIRIARDAAKRPLKEMGVLDAGLCHGAAGLGHIFNRMFQATGEEDLEEAARFWLGRALEMRKPGRGIAGFSAWLGSEERWINDPGLLTGTAGIGLALLAAITPVEPLWDRMLLVSIPPRD